MKITKEVLKQIIKEEIEMTKDLTGRPMPKDTRPMIDPRHLEQQKAAVESFIQRYSGNKLGRNLESFYSSHQESVLKQLSNIASRGTGLGAGQLESEEIALAFFQAASQGM
jgi:hypothetical protein